MNYEKIKKLSIGVSIKSEEIKKLLNSYLHKKELLKSVCEVIRQAEESMGDLQACDYSGTKFSGGETMSIEERAVLRLEKLRKKKNDILVFLFDKEDEIHLLIDNLRDDEQAIIIDRYINALSLRELAKKYYYTYDSMRVKINRVINKLGEQQ